MPPATSPKNIGGHKKAAADYSFPNASMSSVSIASEAGDGTELSHVTHVSAKPTTDGAPAGSTHGGATTQQPPPTPPKPTMEGGGDDRSCFRRFISVRAIAAAMCFLLIVATAAVVIAVTSTYSLRAAQDIAADQALAISSKAKGDVEDFLNVPLRAVRGWQYTLAGGQSAALPKDDPQALLGWTERLVAPMGANNFLFDFSVVGFEDGSYNGCQNVGSTYVYCNLINWGDRDINNASDTSSSTSYYYLRSNFSQSRVRTGSSTYDPRTRSWYTSVNHTLGAIQWTPVYLSLAPAPIIDVNAAIFNSSGTFIGVAGLSFGLLDLTRFISQLITTDNTFSFLIDNDGQLLASSYAEPFLTSTSILSSYSGSIASNCLRSYSSGNTSVLACRATAATYGYAPLQQLIQKDAGLVASGRAGSTSVFTLDGKRYYVAVVPIETPLASGMGWRFALFLPEDDIIGGIVKGRNIAIYICIGVVAAAVIIALVVITLLLRPLDAVAERMYRVAMMQDVDEEEDDDDNEASASAKTAPTTSSLYEVATIQTAFNTMTAELAKIKSFLPQSVLAQLYGALGDDDEEGDGTTCAAETEGGTGGGSSKGNSRRSTMHEAGSESQGNLVDASSRDSSIRIQDAKVRVPRRQSATNTHASSATYGASSNGGTHNGGKQGAASLNTSVKLSSRKVTMLCLNVLGYHKHVQRRSTDDTVRSHATIVKAVSDACAEFRGVMDGFQGDRFTISFNAVTNAGSHAVLAARTARAVTEAVRARTSLTVSSGLASGSAMVGNMGSATTKRFTVLSSVVSSAVLLERLSKRYCTESSSSRLLVGGSAVQDLEPFFDMLTLDAVLLPTSAALGKRSRVCSVMGVREAASDEWMYEMQEGANNSPFAAANEAFGMFLDGMVCEAGVVVGEQLEETSEAVLTPDEAAARSVLRLVERLVSCANESGDAAGEYGRTYVNALSDYYNTCALPTGCVSIPATAIASILKEIPSKQDPLLLNSSKDNAAHDRG